MLSLNSAITLREIFEDIIILPFLLSLKASTGYYSAQLTSLSHSSLISREVPYKYMQIESLLRQLRAHHPTTTVQGGGEEGGELRAFYTPDELEEQLKNSLQELKATSADFNSALLFLHQVCEWVRPHPFPVLTTPSPCCSWVLSMCSRVRRIPWSVWTLESLAPVSTARYKNAGPVRIETLPLCSYLMPTSAGCGGWILSKTLKMSSQQSDPVNC